MSSAPSPSSLSKTLLTGTAATCGWSLTYRWFIQNFSRVAKPLNALVEKDRKWEWRKKQQNTFEVLKRRFITEPVLAVPNRDQEIRVEADALDYVTGETLSVKGKVSQMVTYLFVMDEFGYSKAQKVKLRQ